MNEDRRGRTKRMPAISSLDLDREGYAGTAALLSHDRKYEICRIANTKYAGHFAAVTAFIATVKAQCDRLLAPVVPGRKQPAPVFEGWTEQELARLLARLDAYVTSMV
jgi:hypothetical protein